MFGKILFFLLLPFLWGNQSGAGLFGTPVIVGDCVLRRVGVGVGVGVSVSVSVSALFVIFYGCEGASEMGV